MAPDAPPDALQSSVVRALAMLDLPSEVQAEVERGNLAPATAYEISKVAPAAQAALTEQVLAGRLTRQETARVVRQKRDRRSGRRAPGRAKEVRFRVADGVLVTVRYRRRPTLGTVQALERALAQARAEAAGQEAA